MLLGTWEFFRLSTLKPSRMASKVSPLARVAGDSGRAVVEVGVAVAVVGDLYVERERRGVGEDAAEEPSARELRPEGAAAPGR